MKCNICEAKVNGLTESITLEDMCDECKSGLSYLYAEVELACTHQSKTYDKDFILLSKPPKRKWTCDKCGEIGYESVGVFND